VNAFAPEGKREDYDCISKYGLGLGLTGGGSWYGVFTKALLVPDSFALANRPRLFTSRMRP
jgi:hypothetical protein